MTWAIIISLGPFMSPIKVPLGPPFGCELTSVSDDTDDFLRFLNDAIDGNLTRFLLFLDEVAEDGNELSNTGDIGGSKFVSTGISTWQVAIVEFLSSIYKPRHTSCKSK